MPRAATTRTVEVPGGHLACEIAGASHALPIVLLHQAIADRRVWDRLFSPLSKKYRVVRYDLRGFGGSTPAEREFSAVDDLRSVIEQLKLERPLLVGASMGGRISLDYVVAHPHGARGLVLIAPGFTGMDYPMFPEARPAFDEDERISKAAMGAYAAGDVDGAIEHLRGLWAAALAGKDLELFRTMVRENAAEVLAERSAQHERPVPVKAASRLPTLDVPLTVLVGDQDNPAMPHVGRYLVGQVPRARLKTVPGADHLMNLGSPGVVEEAVDEMFAPAAR